MAPLSTWKSCVYCWRPELTRIKQPLTETRFSAWKASQLGHEDIVRTLLEAGADSNRSKDGSTPLWVACFEKEASVACLLLQAAADVDMATSDSRGPLHVATDCGCTDVVRSLLQARAGLPHPATMAGLLCGLQRSVVGQRSHGCSLRRKPT